jgi:hypothetical protein
VGVGVSGFGGPVKGQDSCAVARFASFEGGQHDTRAAG